jgi:hypothetical protein
MFSFVMFSFVMFSFVKIPTPAPPPNFFLITLCIYLYSYVVATLLFIQWGVEWRFGIVLTWLPGW